VLSIGYGSLIFALAVLGIWVPGVSDAAVVYTRHPLYRTYQCHAGYRYGYWRSGHYQPYVLIDGDVGIGTDAGDR
jgi:hypothetical protein